MVDHTQTEHDVDEPFPPYDPKAASRSDALKQQLHDRATRNQFTTEERVAQAKLQALGEPTPDVDYIDNMLATYPTLRAFYVEKVAHYRGLYPGAPVPSLRPGTRTSWAAIAQTFRDMGPPTNPPSTPPARWS